MKEIPIAAASDAGFIDAEIESLVAAAANSMSLRISMSGSLKQFPGSRHWHLKRETGAGTLELTWWPAQNRLWVSYHANRAGDGWVAESAALLAQEISRLLNSRAPVSTP